MADQYTSKRIVLSLRTRSRRAALRGAQQISVQLENHWSDIRVDQFTKKLARQTNKQSLNPTFEGCGYDLIDARELYLRLKGAGKDDVFNRIAERNIEYVTDAIGNKDLSEYTSTDGAAFRDALISKGLAISSVKRVFSSVRSILNLVIKEHGLQVTNPFAGTYMPEEQSVKKRATIPDNVIRKVQALCVVHNDELRWMVSLISDTGMRLGEACGLKLTDIVLDGPIPHVVIRPNEARRLKTVSSARTIPLAGESFWAARQSARASNTEYLFPRYT